MFTLCMSRESNKHLQDTPANSATCGKQVKGGYLLRYKRGWLCFSWSEEWVVLYEDSTLAWFPDKGCLRPRGYIRLRDAPELLCAGEWTRRVPRRPRLPPHCRVHQLLALARAEAKGVCWLMAQSPQEVNDWMIAISNTLPPPPRLTIDRDKRGSVLINQNERPPQRCFSNDHTVPPGVVMEWGHGYGWGWGEALTTICAPEVAATSTGPLYCTDDYSIGGLEDMDYSACGDFSF